MIKQVLMSLGAGAVLLIGLVSCAKEKKVTLDVYDPAPPEIRSPSGNLSKAVSGAELDLQDQLDFSKSKPSTIEIRGNCLQDGKSTDIASQSFAESQISILRILPPEYLTHCNLFLRLENGVGSSRLVVLNNLVLRDGDHDSVRLGRSDGMPLENPLHMTQLSAVQVRSVGTERAQAKVLCETFSVESVNFESVLNMDHFDFVKRQVQKRPRPAAVDQCRVIVIKSPQVIVASAIFQILVPGQQLAILETNQTASAAQAWTTLNLRRDCNFEPQVVGLLRIANPELYSRYVRLPTHYYPYHRWDFDPRFSVYPIDQGDEDLELRPTPESIVQQAPGHRILQVPAGGELDFTLYYRPRGAANTCQPSHPPLAATALKALEPFEIQETDSHGKIYESSKFILNQCFAGYLGSPATLTAAKAGLALGCL